MMEEVTQLTGVEMNVEESFFTYAQGKTAFSAAQLAIYLKRLLIIAI